MDLYPSLSGNEGYVIVCANCIDGVSEYDSFTYEQRLVGVGCPRMTTFHSSCQDFEWNANQDGYECVCPNGECGTTYTKVTFSTTISQPVRSGCIATTAANLVQGCKTYTYDSNPANWKCNAC